jgi:cell division protein FtsZ
MTIEMVVSTKVRGNTCIKVVGVGGAGNNAVDHMIRCAVEGAEFININTDAQVLEASQADVLVQLGEDGQGAGDDPLEGRKFANAAREEIRAAIEGADMLFVTAGMGGGTGTGAAPVVGAIAKELGILTVGVVTRPFTWEGSRCVKNAEAGLAEMEQNVSSLLVIRNDALEENLDADVTEDDAYAYADDVLKDAVNAIVEIINTRGRMNVDFKDVRAVMNNLGRALMGTGVAHGDDRAVEAAKLAAQCPLLEGAQLVGARGLLVLISTAQGKLKLRESRAVMDELAKYSAPHAQVIFGTATDESLGDALRVTVIAAGLGGGMQLVHSTQASSAQQVQAEAQQMVVPLRTGTDNVLIPTISSVVVPQAGVPVAGGAAVDVQVGQHSVWRTRTQAVEKITQLSNGGMEEMDIPAFLRKQAD